jgi:hypothetical protein
MIPEMLRTLLLLAVLGSRTCDESPTPSAVEPEVEIETSLESPPSEPPKSEPSREVIRRRCKPNFTPCNGGRECCDDRREVCQDNRCQPRE